MKKLLTLLGKNKGFFFVTLAIGILYSAVGVAVPTVSGRLITAVVSGSGNPVPVLIAFFLVSLLQIGLSELDEYAGNTLKIRQKSSMRKRAFRAFSHHDGAGKEETASFVSFVNNDIPSIAEQYVLGTIDILKCASIILFSALSLLYIHWLLALVIVTISVLIVLLPNSMRKKGGAARKVYSGVLGRYNTTLQSVVDGLKVVKAYRCQKFTTGNVDGADDAIVKSEGVLVRHQLIVQGITTFLQVSKTVLILILGIGLISRNKMDVGGLVAVVQLAAVISAPIEVLAYLRHSRNEVLPILDQYAEMAAPETQPEGDAPVESFRELSIRNLSYAVEDYSILQGVSMDFAAGGKYLITGESGSGKSTLLRLIARIGDTGYTGEIRYNGREIRNLDHAGYYRQVCPVFQEPYLFYATLEDNICLGRAISREVYRDVIEKLNLSYLLDRCQNQELTPELTEKLSGGEKQRVALARAMVGQPAVYLLDEVTSALDPQNAALVEALLLRQSATVIHVCHKQNPALADQYNAKFTLAQGRLLPPQ